MGRRSARRFRVGAAAIIVLPLVLAACVGRGGGKQISWMDGTPSQAYLAALGTVFPTATAPAPTAPPPPPTTAPPTATPVLRLLTAADRARVQPNEAGGIPILMYHVITPGPAPSDDGYARSADDFAGDLQKLYDLNYYVVPLRSVIENRLDVPAGKHPVALTFDDATAGQFRYLIGEDGTVEIDPRSAVGIMEAFFAAHPDFGRGGFFAVPAATCFDWEAAAAEPDQTPYCGQKLTWLLQNGYEVGNHTVSHTDLRDVNDQEFLAAIGGEWQELQALAPGVRPDILALPYGNYPDAKKHADQRALLRDGFTYQGTTIKLIGALMVGANPAPSPATVDWDPLFIPRIRAYDGEYGSTEWLDVLAGDPSQLYTSDGDPAAVTVPASLADGLDRQRLDTAGLRVVTYDPKTGAET